MKIKLLAALVGKPPAVTPSIKASPKDFKDVMNGQKPNIAPVAPSVKDLFKEIQEIQKAILNGKELTGKDLIMYQIKTGQYSMRVELISKVAEAAVSTVKKFQNPQ